MSWPGTKGERKTEKKKERKKPSTLKAHPLQNALFGDL